MNLLPDSDQQLVADSARDLLDRHSPPGRLRVLPEVGPVRDTALWQQCAAQGWFGLTLPESGGGAGLGLAEHTLLFTELGRHLTAGPFLGTVLAAGVAHAAGAVDLLEGILDGAAPVGLAERRRATGVLRTFDADDAELFVIVGRDGAELAEVPSWRFRRRAVHPAARWAEEAADVREHVRIDGADTWRRGCVLVAAMLAGVAAATRDIGSAYAAVREAFGRPIGAFQAVKHRCADTAVRAEASGQLTVLAALAVGDQRPDADLLASSARLVAARAAVENARDTIQNLGGIGFTEEHDAGLFLTKAHVLSVTVGDAATHEAAVVSAPPVRERFDPFRASRNG